MPRGNFLEASRGGGAGFQEGFVLIEKSVATVFQYPPNAKTGVQSDPFCALVWTGKRLDSEWNELPFEDGSDFEIVIRMGALDKVRPGQLAAKDFDNLEVEPEDLGAEVGVSGNCFYLVEGSFHQNWGKMKDSLEAKSFKKEILGRGITSDFEGMKAHFKMVEGEKYVARQGAKKGETVTPTHLECDRIHTYPYAAKAAAKPAQGKLPGKPNGATDAMTEAKQVFANLSPQFRTACPAGKDIDRPALEKALKGEFLRQKLQLPQQKAILDFLKTDENMTELAIALIAEGHAAFVCNGDGSIMFG